MERVTIIGGGAIGLLICARLVLSGQEVELIVRTEEQKRELNASALELTDLNGNRMVVERSERITVTTAAEVENVRERQTAGEPHIIVLAVKQIAFTSEFIEFIERLSGPQTWFICMQNGIGHAERLAERISPAHIWLSVTTEGALKQSGYQVAHTGQGTTWIGPLASEESEDSLTAQKMWTERMELAGFRMVVSKDITSRVWHKLLINAVINPLTAILGIKNGELSRQADANRLMRLLFDESAALANRHGIVLADDLWEQVLEVCSLTANNRSSMLQDILAGRTTEIEAISGGLLRLAARAAHPMPVTETVYRLVKALEGRGQTRA